MEPHTYTFVMVLAVVMSALDAFAIGANDVANSFATSVAAKSIKLWQSLVIACFAEFLGALLLGSGVAETIRKGIVDIKKFKEEPQLLMVGMFAANIGSTVCVMVATFAGLPVSTTHAIVGGVIGMGIACYGFDAVIWGWTPKGKGFSVVVASWFISPAFAAVLGAIFYQVTLRTVMLKEDSYAAAKVFVPFYFFFTVGTILFYLAYKGAPIVKSWDLEAWEVALISIVPALFVGIISYFVVVPKVLVPRIEKGFAEGASQREKAKGEVVPPKEMDEIETVDAKLNESTETSSPKPNSGKKADSDVEKESKSVKETLIDIFIGPITKDVLSLDTDRQITLHSESEKYDERTERLFSFLQVVTATCASFSHGANDLANALSPMATVYAIWSTGVLPDKKFEIPIWQICYTAFMLDVGLWMLGWRIMKELGNNLCYHSPSRGFNMELATLFTVLTASRLGIPVSTTHCTTGATAGVALAQGNGNQFNWYKFSHIFLGWIFTVPVAALVAGCLTGLMIDSPHRTSAERVALIVNGSISYRY